MLGTRPQASSPAAVALVGDPLRNVLPRSRDIAAAQRRFNQGQRDQIPLRMAAAEPVGVVADGLVGRDRSAIAALRECANASGKRKADIARHGCIRILERGGVLHALQKVRERGLAAGRGERHCRMQVAERVEPRFTLEPGGPVVGDPFEARAHIDAFEPQSPQERGGIDARIVCIPEVAVAPGDPLEGRFTEEIDWLKRCYASGATLATACSGAVLLAEAGLLDGQEATTHWAFCDLLRSRYPRITVRKERALVVSGEGQRLIMAGGGTSWKDVALYLIARFAGIDAAMHVARMNLIDWHAIGQQPFARLSTSRQVSDAQIARCQRSVKGAKAHARSHGKLAGDENGRSASTTNITSARSSPEPLLETCIGIPAPRPASARPAATFITPSGPRMLCSPLRTKKASDPGWLWIGVMLPGGPLASLILSR